VSLRLSSWLVSLRLSSWLVSLRLSSWLVNLAISFLVCPDTSLSEWYEVRSRYTREHPFNLMVFISHGCGGIAVIIKHVALDLHCGDCARLFVRFEGIVRACVGRGLLAERLAVNRHEASDGHCF
jgi:hypothetical protein